MNTLLPHRLPVLEGWVRLSFLGFFAWLLERDLRRRAEREARRLHRILDSQYQASSRKEKALEELRNENLFLLRHAFRILGELADNYHSYHSPGALYRLVEDLIRSIDGRPDAREALIGFLDSHLDRHPITELRRALPRLSEEYLVLYCYLVLGLRSKLIIDLMGPVTPQKIYTMTCRLKKRIRRLGPARSGRFEDLLP